MPDITVRSGTDLISAYESKPVGAARGGLILLQELFGVNSHIRKVADGYAAEGYHVIAPALFDRAQKDARLGYDEAAMKQGRALRETVSWEQALGDVAAVRSVFPAGLPVGVLGYCWGGAIAWLAATRVSGLSGVVSYYGGGIGQFADETPQCPVICHFGASDPFIPQSDVARLKELHPQDVDVNVYPAGHGFNCDERASYHEESARQARARSVDFLRRNLG